VNRLPSLLGALVVGLVMSAPSVAVAHAEITSSNPEDNTRVQTMPSHVSLTLSEPVQEPARVAVTSADGTRMNSYDVTVRDDTVTTAINQAAPAGTYTITYEIVSADDHQVSGSMTFAVLTGSTPAPTADATPTPAASTQSGPSGGAAAGRPKINPAAEGSTTKDILTIVGFSIVAMAGLVMLLRAGLRSAGAED
jgi:methionine-rich copper-binding protein CopC